MTAWRSGIAATQGKRQPPPFFFLSHLGQALFTSQSHSGAASSAQNSSGRRSASALCAQNDVPSDGALLAQECPTHYPIDDDPEPTTVFPEPTTSALKERVQFVDADPPTVLPQPAPAPFARVRQQETAPQVVEEVHERVLEALIPSASVSCSPSPQMSGRT